MKNISDAIRWVLGEQSSRSLRGAKMEDVIFGGTARRGPVGFAEVSLILDNSAHVFRSEFIEIMVTRRYYRSGESEYFLNKKHCRLKDVHELFMDTGLGRDGYSSIGQGRIDEILSFKSEDRREIFEEAAGITKFRYRKEEAERRLSATEENLVRIRDLYGELENRLEPLEQQADKAKRFLHLRDELRVLEVSMWLLSLEQLKNDTAKLNKDRTTCEKQLADAKQQQGTLYAQSDVITLHTFLNDSTYHMINTEAIQQMKPGVVIINCARGALIDTRALIDGIESGRVGSVGVDCFEGEDDVIRVDHNYNSRVTNHDYIILKSFQNTIVTPHVAFFTDQAVFDMVQCSLESLHQFELGEKVPLEVHAA